MYEIKCCARVCDDDDGGRIEPWIGVAAAADARFCCSRRPGKFDFALDVDVEVLLDQENIAIML